MRAAINCFAYLFVSRVAYNSDMCLGKLETIVSFNKPREMHCNLSLVNLVFN